MNPLHFCVALVVAGTVACGCVPLPAYVEMKSDLARMETELEKNGKKTERLEIENRQLAGELKDIRQENAQLNTAAVKWNDDLVRCSNQLKKTAEEAQKYKAERDQQHSVVQIQAEVIRLLDDSKQTIQKSLQEQIAEKNIKIVDSDENLRMILVDRILYEPGSLEINEEGKKFLRTLAETFKKDNSYRIVVEGHSDSTPLSRRLQKLYPTNWELSAARAAAIVRFLQWECGVDPKRLSIRAYSHYKPLISNHNLSERGKNRRIEIIFEPL